MIGPEGKGAFASTTQNPDSTSETPRLREALGALVQNQADRIEQDHSLQNVQSWHVLWEKGSGFYKHDKPGVIRELVRRENPDFLQLLEQNWSEMTRNIDWSNLQLILIDLIELGGDHLQWVLDNWRKLTNNRSMGTELTGYRLASMSMADLREVVTRIFQVQPEMAQNWARLTMTGFKQFEKQGIPGGKNGAVIMQHLYAQGEEHQQWVIDNLVEVGNQTSNEFWYEMTIFLVEGNQAEWLRSHIEEINGPLRVGVGRALLEKESTRQQVFENWKLYFSVSGTGYFDTEVWPNLLDSNADWVLQHWDLVADSLYSKSRAIARLVTKGYADWVIENWRTKLDAQLDDDDDDKRKILDRLYDKYSLAGVRIYTGRARLLPRFVGIKNVTDKFRGIV